MTGYVNWPAVRYDEPYRPFWCMAFLLLNLQHFSVTCLVSLSKKTSWKTHKSVILISIKDSEKLVEERKSFAECGNYITKEVLVSIIRTFLKEFTINHVSLFGFPLNCDSNHTEQKIHKKFLSPSVTYNYVNVPVETDFFVDQWACYHLSAFCQRNGLQF